MKPSLSILLFLPLLATLATGQESAPSRDTSAPEPDLKTVLARMDKVAASFKAAQADIELTQYTKVVDEKDVQTGKIYFRRKDGSVEVAVQILKPHAKQVIIKDNQLTMYDPKTNQTQTRDISANRADVESILNLGFGARGQDLLKDYDVKMDGWETINNGEGRVKTAKLELAAKSASMKRFFSKVILWIDPDRDVAIQQQRFEASGDYQLTRYSKIQLVDKISDEKFRVQKSKSD